MYTFQLSSVTELCLAHCNSMDCSMTGFPVHYQILKPAKTHVHQVNDVIQPNYPLLSTFNSAFNFPNISVFFNESVVCIRWPKYCSFSFSISPSNEYLGLISFGNDWLGLLALQRTLKSLLEHHSSKHEFLGAQLSLWSKLMSIDGSYGKTIAFTRHFCWQSNVSAF